MPETPELHAPAADTAATAHDAAAGGAAVHHGFNFNSLNGSHNTAYPAIEWVHGYAPQLILNLPAYAAKNHATLTHSDAFAAALPSPAQSEWAQSWLAGMPETAKTMDASSLAKAMTVAESSAWATMPQPLSFLNHQSFWSTIALALAALVLLVTHKRKADQYKPANRVQHMLEAVVLYVRDEIVRPNIPHHPERWTAFLASLFLAILTMNLFGMVPLFGTITSNIFMTFAWAIVIFILMVYQGMKNNGLGFWLKLVPVKWSWNPMDMFVFILLLALEWMSMVIKPAVLAIRLFANMLAGHTVLLVFMCLGFIVHASNPEGVGMTLGLGALGWVVAIAFYFLEVLVALVQAYVFVMLSAVFIGSCIHPEH